MAFIETYRKKEEVMFLLDDLLVEDFIDEQIVDDFISELQV